jgi:hypothetical protein
MDDSSDDDLVDDDASVASDARNTDAADESILVDQYLSNHNHDDMLDDTGVHRPNHSHDDMLGDERPAHPPNHSHDDMLGDERAAHPPTHSHYDILGDERAAHRPNHNSDDMLDDTVSNVPVRRTVYRQKCWLCTFCPNPLAVEMHNFVVANVACMDFKYLASQIKDEILLASPHVKIASTIRSLVTVAETLKGGLTHRDAESNEVLVDIKNTELYLKVISQLVAAYKLDTSKLLFHHTN